MTCVWYDDKWCFLCDNSFIPSITRSASSASLANGSTFTYDSSIAALAGCSPPWFCASCTRAISRSKSNSSPRTMSKYLGVNLSRSPLQNALYVRLELFLTKKPVPGEPLSTYCPDLYDDSYFPLIPNSVGR